MTDVLSPTNGRTAEARLLVVDDEPNIVELLSASLRFAGFEVLRRLRTGSHPLPVVFLTARDANDDKVTGLTLGGNDYVTKTFSLEEVIARIRAVLRRTRALAGDSPARLTVGDLDLDDDSHQVWRGGREVQLSPTEFNLLRYLMVNAGRVLSKSQILEHVWSYDFD